MKFEIKNRWSGELIFSIETESWKLAVEAAIKSEANLSKADLSCANLSKADLSCANLSEANLSKANLSCANLSTIRNDVWAVLLFAPNEVMDLRKALIDGKVDGSVYEGECACLVGTIAKSRSCKPDLLPEAIRPDSGRAAERFFMGIKKGDTPETNQVSKIAVEWVDTWLEQMKVVHA